MPRKAKKSFFRKAVNTIGGVARIAKTAMGTALMVKKLLNVEYKVHDVTSSGTLTAISGGGDVFSLSAIAQGDDRGERNGDSILLKNFNLRMYVVGNDTVVSVFRMLIFFDNDNRGETPAMTDVLDTATLMSHRNLDNIRRFTVLHDKFMTIGSTTHNNRIKKIQVNKTFSKKHIKFTGPTSGSGDYGNGALFMIILSGNSTNMQSYDMRTRLRYIDN